MSNKAVPMHEIAGKPQDNITMNPVEEEMFSDFEISNESRKLLRESRSQAMFLTKIAGLMVFASLFPVGVNLFIIFQQIAAKTLYRSMNMDVMTWVYLGLAIFVSLLGGCMNRFLAKLQPILFLLFCVFSGLTFFGLFWFFNNTNESAYEYSGHYVIIIGFCLCAMSMGYLFSTLIRVRNISYSVLAGLFFMPVFVIIALVVCANVFTVHTMKAYQYTLVGLAFSMIGLYISLNSKFMLTLRLEKYYENEIAYGFFCMKTDILLFFWIDLCKTIFGKKKKKNRRRPEIRGSQELA